MFVQESQGGPGAHIKFVISFHFSRSSWQFAQKSVFQHLGIYATNKLRLAHSYFKVCHYNICSKISEKKKHPKKEGGVIENKAKITVY